MQIGFLVNATKCLTLCQNCPRQEARPSLPEEPTQPGEKRENWMECGNSMFRRKVTLLSNCGNVNGWKSTSLKLF